MVITAVILTLLYNAIVISKNKGIPPSLSDSFYIFGGKPKGYLLYGYFVAMFLLLISPILKLTPDNWDFVGFLMLAALVFVGVAGDFKSEKSEHNVHVFCALGSAVLSAIWSLVTGNIVIFGICTIIFGALALLNSKNKTYWLEMICFSSILHTISVRL